MNFEELIKSVDGFSKHHSAIRGYVDVINKDGFLQMKDTDCYWVMFGCCNDDIIQTALKDYVVIVEKPGVYEFDAVIHIDHGTYDEPPEYYVIWENWKFIETIEARDRNLILNGLLTDDIDFLK